MEIINSERLYALQYARQHAIYEKYAYPIFYKALKESMTVAITTFNPDDVKMNVWQAAYRKAYVKIGVLAARREYYYQKKENVKASDVVEFFNELFRMEMVKYADSISLDFSKDLTDTTKEQIVKAVSEASSQSLTRNQTARLIYEYTLGVIGRNRALVIARTETTTASNLGKIEGAKTYLKEIGDTSGGYKLWITRMDGKERHDHAVVNGEIVPFDDKFDVGGFEGNVPGDPALPAKERVRCRCTFVALSQRQYLRRTGQL